MSDMNIELKDLDDLGRFYDQMEDRFHEASKLALERVIENPIMSESAEEVNFDTGTLRRSKVVLPAVIEADRVYIDYGYGTNYAVFLHENTQGYHIVPKKAKMLSWMDRKTGKRKFAKHVFMPPNPHAKFLDRPVDRNMDVLPEIMMQDFTQIYMEAF